MSRFRARRGIFSGRNLRVALILCSLVFVLNANDLRGFFVGDDLDILANVKFQRDFVDVLDMTYVDNWGPMSYAQFYLNLRMGGLDPLLYHLTNLFWFSLAVIALYAFVRVTWPEAPFVAWCAALLFATHPVHDEAVSYICGRSHTVATAMAALSIALYARYRLQAKSPAERSSLLVGAFVAAFFAGLAKQSALTLPAWIAAFEWLFCRDDGESLLGSLQRIAKAAGLFAIAAAATPALRLLVTTRESRYLGMASGEAGKIWEGFIEDPPLYALHGGLPIPFSWIAEDSLGAARLLGWGLVVAAFVVGVWCFRLNARGPAGSNKAAGLYVFGLTVAAVTLTPLMAAEVPMRRRYLLIASLGIVLMAAVVFNRLHARYPRGATVLLSVVLVAGAIGLIQRNDLYRRSGQAVKGMLETLIDAPVPRKLTKAKWREARAIVLITLPRMYGGDLRTGAQMLHVSDLDSALIMLGVRVADISYAMKCYYADDYTAEAQFVNDLTLMLRVSFRSRRAFEAARRRDPEEDRVGHDALATLVELDVESREIVYRVSLRDGFWEAGGPKLFVYSDGALSRLRPSRQP